MPKFTISKYAERVGVSRAYLYKLVKQDKIVITLKGKKKLIDSDQADSIVKYKPAHRATTKTAQKNGAKRKGVTTPPEDENELPKLDENATTEELERIKLFEQARKLRNDNDKNDKITINRKETENTWFKIIRSFRDSVEVIPGNISGLLVGKSKHKIEQVLIKELKRSLTNLGKII